VTLVSVVDGWDELADAPNPSHGVVAASVDVAAGVPPGDGMTGPRRKRAWPDRRLSMDAIAVRSLGAVVTICCWWFFSSPRASTGTRLIRSSMVVMGPERSGRGESTEEGMGEVNDGGTSSR
jgi:hypothetical protein